MRIALIVLAIWIGAGLIVGLIVGRAFYEMRS